MSALSQKDTGQLQAQQGVLQGTSADLQKSQVGLEEAMTERKMRMQVAQLLSTNEASAGARGISLDPGTSFDVIQKHDVSSMEENIANMRLMGESKKAQLSFAAEDAVAAGQAAQQGANTGMWATLLSGGAKALGMGKLNLGDPSKWFASDATKGIPDPGSYGASA
jgi:hypothetical protein